MNNNNNNNNNNDLIRKDIILLSQFSFNQLKKELLKNYNHPKREYIIRKLMVNKYNQQKQKIIDDFVEELNNNDNNNSNNDNLDNFIEYPKDKMNDNIISRLNTDLDIKKSKKRLTTAPQQLPPIIQPYSDKYTSSGIYAPFNSNEIIKLNNFSNIKKI